MRAATVVCVLSFLLPATLASDLPICSSALVDPPNDLQQKEPLPQDTPEADILRYEITLTTDTLWLNLTLAKSPIGESVYFRYWLGFNIATPDHPDPVYLDARIGSTATYDTATLIASNSHNNNDMGKLPATWSGSTVSIAAPLQNIRAEYGPTFKLGGPRAATDGAHKEILFQGPYTAIPYVQDFTDFNVTFVPLVPCTSPAPIVAPATAPQIAKTPLAALAPIAAIVLGALLARKRS